jgi:hypothetical protein
MTHWSGLPSFTYFGEVLPQHLKACAAAHEASHAVIGAHFGLDMGEISITLHREIEGVSGLVEIEGDEIGNRISQERLPGWMIGCAAGQVGEAMWWQRYQKCTFEQGMINADAGAATDRAMFVKFGGKNPPITLPQARLMAQTLLTPRWALVSRYAATLVHDGRMAGRKIQSEGN